MLRRNQLLLIYALDVYGFFNNPEISKKILETKEEEHIKALKNARIEQCLKLANSKGEINKRTRIEQWLQQVEEERKPPPQNESKAKSPVGLKKITKPTSLRRSARLLSKKQSSSS